MASSSIHLFDPDNASSGHALRSWVEKHRAEGADWRDERLLTDEAVDELRRWDRCLKAWARVRFEPQSTTESRHGPRSVRTEPSDQILQPVRLQFEQLSLASPPSTPFYAKTRAPATVSDLISFASPVTPDNPNFLASPARFETPAPSRRQTPYAQTSSHVRELQVTQPTPIHHSMIPGNEVRAISQMTPSGQATSARHFMGTATETTPSPSAWSKPPLLGLARRVDARKPLSEVSINRVGNTINVTVPTPNQLGVKAEDEYEYSLAAARPSQENINPRALHRNPSAYSSTSTKSWRNAVLEVPKQPSSEDERIHAFRMAAKNLFVSEPNEPSAPPKASPALRTDIDWGNLRRRNFAGSQPAQPTTQARPHDA